MEHLRCLSRTEQNFKQRGSGITPGADIVVDWGIGRMVRVGGHQLDAGVSGFGDWQITSQDGGPPGTDTQRYRLLGAGPEANFWIIDPLAVRVRAQWEFAAKDIVRGNNVWFIANYRF